MEGNQERFQEKKKDLIFHQILLKNLATTVTTILGKYHETDDYGEISTKQATNVTS